MSLTPEVTALCPVLTSRRYLSFQDFHETRGSLSVAWLEHEKMYPSLFYGATERGGNIFGGFLPDHNGTTIDLTRFLAAHFRFSVIGVIAPTFMYALGKSRPAAPNGLTLATTSIQGEMASRIWTMQADPDGTVHRWAEGPASHENLTFRPESVFDIASRS